MKFVSILLLIPCVWQAQADITAVSLLQYSDTAKVALLSVTVANLTDHDSHWICDGCTWESTVTAKAWSFAGSVRTDKTVTVTEGGTGEKKFDTTGNWKATTYYLEITGVNLANSANGLHGKVATGVDTDDAGTTDFDKAANGCNCGTATYVHLNGQNNMLKIKFQCNVQVPAGGFVYFDFFADDNAKAKATALTGKKNYFGHATAPTDADHKTTVAFTAATTNFHRVKFTATSSLKVTADTDTYFYYYPAELDLKTGAKVYISSSADAKYGDTCAVPATLATGTASATISSLFALAATFIAVVVV